MSIALTTASRLLTSNVVVDDTFCKVTTDVNDIFIKVAGLDGDLEVGRAERDGEAVGDFEGLREGATEGVITGGGESMDGALDKVGLELAEGLVLGPPSIGRAVGTDAS